jgi:hypothetical protein
MREIKLEKTKIVKKMEKILNEWLTFTCLNYLNFKTSTRIPFF